MIEVIVTETREYAKNMRKLILDALLNSKSGHPGGSLSCTDILAVLYNEEMNIDPKNPKKEDRDRLVLSKGHASPALYAALALKGFFPVSEMLKFRKIDSFLEGHPEMKSVPGVDMSTGSLGQGVSAACGIALSGKKKNENYHVYTILGDGECQEGQVWEAFMFAAHHKLDNLCIFIDNNGLQIDGNIEDVMSPLPLKEKLLAFNLNVIEIDGHDINAIKSAIAAAKTVTGKPTAVIAKTVKGKGVSFMENVASWHGTPPNAEQHAQAIKEVMGQ